MSAMRPVRPPPPKRRRPRAGTVEDGWRAGSRRGGRLVVIDNYDSFTRNLADGFAQLGADVTIVRNDATSVARVLSARPFGVVLSPGPHAPAQAGICLELLRRAPAALPILGVCLGHQAIGEAFGGRVVRAASPVHGRALVVHHAGRGVLARLRSPFPAARYHSLVVEERSLPRELVATAWSESGEIMALVHRDRPIEGVQFHPESYLTPVGPSILAAFLRRCGRHPGPARGVVR